MIDIQPGVIFKFTVPFTELGSANEGSQSVNVKVTVVGWSQALEQQNVGKWKERLESEGEL